MNDAHDLPIIVGFVADVMFGTRIADAARRAGFRVQWIERAADVGDVDPDAPPERPGELLHGREGRLFDHITAWQPALLLFDLTNTAVPWQRWIPMLKSSPATRRIPIMAFGPHEDVARMTEARRVGADLVLARSRFTADMPALFQQHARVPDRDALATTCAEPLPPLVVEGLTLFNQGEYYKCHDSLEEAWRQDETPGRDLYRGVLQVGIAYYQIERGNYRGAVKMLLRVRQWLDPLPAVCRGVDVAQLRADVTAVYDSLVTLGPDGLEDFDRGLFKPLRYEAQ